MQTVINSQWRYGLIARWALCCSLCFPVLPGWAQKLPMPIGTGSITSSYWTFNPSYSSTTGIAFSSGNDVLTFNNSSQNVSIATLPGGTTGKSTGKWYWEITLTTGGGVVSIGVESGLSPSGYTQNLGQDANGYAYYSNAGGWWCCAAASASFGACGSSYWSSSGNVVGIALNAGGNSISFYLNGTLQCSQTISGGNYFPAVSSIQTNVLTANFGASAWAYTPPTGYVALN